MAITRSTYLLTATLAAALSASPAVAQPAAKTQMVATNAPIMSSKTVESLAPQLQTNNMRLDYTILSEALEGTVIRLGPSHRRHMGRPDPKVGSRFSRGHSTPYRLEGSRVSFSFFSEEFLEELSAYRADLEAIGSSIDLTHMAKNEQLAYWLNLHNVAMIEQISKQYPIKHPNRLTIDGISIEDAKVLTVKGIPLSLRDIREKIVFPNWDKTETMYGFFRGNIGSPALQNYAYTGSNVHDMLAYQAGEFVNALRGFNLSSKNRNVSRLYEEVKPFYFQNWETDLQTHLLKYARDDVAEDIRKDRPWRIDRYDEVVADLVGGNRPRIATSHVSNPGSAGTAALPDEVIQLLRELETKTDILRKRKWIGTGTVTIEDVETIDVDIPPPPSSTE